MGEMLILGPSGDTKITWNPENENEVEAAANQFNELMGKGFLAFTVTKVGRKGIQIKKFQPKAGKMILVPPIAGG